MEHLDAYTAKLDAYLDNELEPEDREAVRAHLETCPECRAYVEELSFIRSVLPDTEHTSVPDDFTAGVMAVIRADAVPQRKPLGFYIRRFVPIAACLAILVGVVQLSSHYNWSKSTADVAEKAGATVEQASLPEPEESAPSNRITAEEFPHLEPNTAIKGVRSGLAKTDTESSTPPAITSYDMAEEVAVPNPADYVEWLELTDAEVGTRLDDTPPLTAEDGRTYYVLSYADFQTFVTTVYEDSEASTINQLPSNAEKPSESDLCCIVVTSTAE